MNFSLNFTITKSRINRIKNIVFPVKIHSQKPIKPQKTKQNNRKILFHFSQKKNPLRKTPTNNSKNAH